MSAERQFIGKPDRRSWPPAQALCSFGLHLQTKKAFSGLFTSGARDRNRTGTGFRSRRILSPVRLPVPPPGHY